MFEPLATTNFSNVAPDAPWMATLAASALVATHLRHSAAAEQLLALLSPHAGHVVTAGAMPWGSVAHYLAFSTPVSVASKRRRPPSPLPPTSTIAWARPPSSLRAGCSGPRCSCIATAPATRHGPSESASPPRGVRVGVADG